MASLEEYRRLEDEIRNAETDALLARLEVSLSRLRECLTQLLAFPTERDDAQAGLAILDKLDEGLDATKRKVAMKRLGVR